MEKIKTKLGEKIAFSFEGLLDEELSDSTGLEKVENNDLETLSPKPNDEFLDKIFSIAKWLLLYLPGVAVIHLSMVGFTLMLFNGEYEFIGLLGLIAFGTFLVMLGLGKMKDLKYLKSVFTVIGFSFLFAILGSFLALFFQGDFWLTFTKLTFPLIALIGFLSKRAIDKETEND